MNNLCGRVSPRRLMIQVVTVTRSAPLWCHLSPVGDAVKDAFRTFFPRIAPSSLWPSGSCQVASWRTGGFQPLVGKAELESTVLIRRGWQSEKALCSCDSGRSGVLPPRDSRPPAGQQAPRGPGQVSGSGSLPAARSPAGLWAEEGERGCRFRPDAVCPEGHFQQRVKPGAEMRADSSTMPGPVGLRCTNPFF